MQVAKWGNSLAIRLPAAVVDALGLKEGDDIEVVVANEETFGIRKKLSNHELLERLRQYRGTLPKDFKFVRDDSNER
jgi:antitoxin MazE